MQLHEDRDPPLSREARHVMAQLLRRGGTMRVRPLLAACGLPLDTLAAALNELAARGWADVVWRGPEARRPASLPERVRDVRRVVATRFGRFRYRTTWPAF